MVISLSKSDKSDFEWEKVPEPTGRANAQKKIAEAIADFQKNEDGVRVAAEITSLRLADIAFDSKTLRVIAEADGTINIYITALRGP